MKKYLLIIAALATAASAYAVSPVADNTRTMATKPVVVPSPTDYVLGIYSTGSGKQIRRNTVSELLGRNIAFKQMTGALKPNTITVAGLNTTAAEGQRYLYPYNGNTAFVGTPEAGMIQTTTTGVQWYGTVTGVTGWHPVGGASSLSGISDWPSGVSATEAGFLDGVTSAVQGQFDALNAQLEIVKAQLVNLGGTTAPVLSVTPTSWNYGSLSVGSTAYNNFEISNAGLSTASVFTHLLTTGTNYTISSDTCGTTLAAGAKCFTTVAFTPSTTGALTDTLTLSASGLTPLTVALTGSGLSTAVAADYAWPLTDNAATSTVVASTGGINGALNSGLTNAMQTGSGFALLATNWVNIGKPPSTANDVAPGPSNATWSMQCDVRYRGNAFGSAALFQTSNNAAAIYITNATTLNMYINGGVTNLGAVTIPSIAADTTSWTTIRAVYNGASNPKTFSVYTGPNENELVLRRSVTADITTTWGGSTKFKGWGTSAGNEIRNLKLWNTAVAP